MKQKSRRLTKNQEYQLITSTYKVPRSRSNRRFHRYLFRHIKEGRKLQYLLFSKHKRRDGESRVIKSLMRRAYNHGWYLKADLESLEKEGTLIRLKLFDCYGDVYS